MEQRLQALETMRMRTDQSLEQRLHAMEASLERTQQTMARRLEATEASLQQPLALHAMQALSFSSMREQLNAQVRVVADLSLRILELEPDVQWL